MSLKKLLFKHFAKIEAKEKAKEEAEQEKKIDLTQPEGYKGTGTPPESDEKKQKRNSIIKKTLWIVGTIAIVGTIIGVSVYFATKKDYIEIQIKSVTASGNYFEFTTTDGAVYRVSKNAIFEARPITNNGNYTFRVATVNNSLPISFNGIRDTDSAGKAIFHIGSTIIDETNNKELHNSLTIATSNANVPSPGFNWVGLLSILMPIATLLLLLFFYSRMYKNQFSGELFGGSSKNLIQNKKTNVKFTDVAGIDEVKDELIEIVDFLKRPNKYIEMGARCPKGVILYGPPGTGKTLIAKAVAGEASCNFYPISGSSFDDMFVGSGMRRVKELFATARKNAPAIIFIDEIDAVASKRGKNDMSMGGDGIANQTINQLLAEMDGFNTQNGVVVIGATNRVDSIDEAILRPGRFDRQIQVSLPDIKEREEILKLHSKVKKISKNVSFLEIARRTPGFSGAQLENVLNEATLLAVRENKDIITMAEIDEAIDRTIGGPKKRTRVMTEQEKKQIAYHEAGHALVGLHTKDSLEVVQKITIIPRGNAAGYTLQTPQEQEKQIQSKKDLLNLVSMTLGGRAAEEIIFGKDAISTGAANDLYKVTRIVKAMVTQLGMTELGLTQFVPTEGNHSPLEKFYSESTSQKIDSKVEQIILEQYNNAKEIISKNRKELDLIVETLLLLETIVKAEIDYIHKHLKLPPTAIAIKNRMKEEKDKDADQNSTSDITTPESDNKK